MPSLFDFVSLWRISRKRIASEADYLEFQSFQARLVTNYLSDKSVFLEQKRVLDLGSGIGGYALEFREQGAKVVSADLIQPRRPSKAGLDPTISDALHLPFCDNCFDVVFCASLIEHVAQPECVVDEIVRVLCPNGFAYISFPPYYSPLGGHEYAPFHYLGEKLAMRLVKRKHVIPPWVKELYPVNDDPKSFGDLYKGWGLYKMTISKMKSLLASNSLVCIDISTRYFPLGFARWPWLGELLTWHVQFLVKKIPTK